MRLEAEKTRHEETKIRGAEKEDRLAARVADLEQELAAYSETAEQILSRITTVSHRVRGRYAVAGRSRTPSE